MSSGTWRTHVFCKDCDWNGRRYQCPYGHNDYVCPICGRETIVELPVKIKSNYPVSDEATDEVYKP